MWLPKNERALLAFCCTKISRGEAPFNLTHQEIIEELKAKGIQADRQFVHETLFTLQNRNLLRWSSCTDGNSVGITLYQQGYDLGEKYNSSWLVWSNLWYSEHIKNHWIWVFVAFLAGIVVPRLVNWASVLFTKYLGAK